MKNIKLIIALVSILLLNSCEEVVQIDLNSAAPKLVVEASIIWYKNSTGNAQKIKLSTTTDYYSTTTPIVSGAEIYIKNSLDSIYHFEEIPTTGEYVCTNFEPVVNEKYTLTIIYDGQTFQATEILKGVAPITRIEQNNNAGFTGDQIQLKSYFEDPDGETNYYLYQYSYSDELKQNYYADEDTFFQGNSFFSISQSDNIEKGDEVIVSHYGISKTYYNYMNVLLSIAGKTGGSPFQSPPATVRGNIINTTNPSEFALGYFSLCESDIQRYVVK